MSISQSEIEIIASKVFDLGAELALSGHAHSHSDIKKAEAEAVSIVRDELSKAGVAVQRKRHAIIECGQSVHPAIAAVKKFLPSNYTAKEGSGYAGACIEIEGYDRAGWTLDNYVIPRLASGMIIAKELSNGTD